MEIGENETRIKLHNDVCEKVWNLARYIEKYPWITKGYETFNTSVDTFFVAECLHYEKQEYPKPVPTIKRKRY